MKEQHEDPRDRRTLPLPELYDSGPGASPEDDEEPITENQPALPPPRSVSGKERFTLVVLEGHDAGAVFDVDRPNLKVGRGRDADLRLDDPGVSRTHAVVSRIGSAVYLEDLGSMNGTLVDGVRICGARRLGDRQRVGLGTTTLRFSVQDSLEADLAVRLYESSVRDPLTRLYNRRHFQERLTSELSFARRNGSDLSLVLVDVDHFKRVNDSHGHRAGDEVLRELARLFEASGRAEDVVARLGGEEFVLLLRNVALEGATALAERIRVAAASLEVPWDGRALRVTVSVGVAAHGSRWAYPDAETLVSSADEALYRAKSEGRDRVVVHEPRDPSDPWPSA